MTLFYNLVQDCKTTALYGEVMQINPTPPGKKFSLNDVEEVEVMGPYYSEEKLHSTVKAKYPTALFNDKNKWIRKWNSEIERN